MTDVTLFAVALGFARASTYAGSRPDDGDPPATAAVRALRLIEAGYVKRGDPAGWDPAAAEAGRVVASVFVEPRGGEGDCAPPLDYWRVWPKVDLWPLTRYHWQWINAAVALVYDDDPTVSLRANPYEVLQRAAEETRYE